VTAWSGINRARSKTPPESIAVVSSDKGVEYPAMNIYVVGLARLQWTAPSMDRFGVKPPDVVVPFGGLSHRFTS
jgi:hypothetical protein